MSVPIRFDGSTEQREANIHSHFWVDDGDAGVCDTCSCKPFHVAAAWPCGVDVPRQGEPGGNPPVSRRRVCEERSVKSNEER